MLGELGFDRCQLPGIACELDCHAVELLRCLRNQFGQTDGGQQTRSYPARKTLADLAQHRQAGPQGVTRGGVGIIGQRIQKQIGQAMPRQMVGR